MKTSLNAAPIVASHETSSTARLAALRAGFGGLLLPMVGAALHLGLDLSPDASHARLTTALEDPLFWVLMALPLAFAVSAYVTARKQDLIRRRSEVLERDLSGDLNESKQELASTNAFLRSALGALPQLISYVDQDLVYAYVNPAYSKWFGLDAADLLGRSVVDVVGDEGFAVIEPYFAQARAGEAVTFSATINYKIGGKRHIVASYTPHRAGGSLQGFVIVVQNVTDEKEKDEELRRSIETARASEDKLRAVVAELSAAQAESDRYFMISPDLLAAMDGDGRMLRINPAFTNALGYLIETLQGRPFLSMLHDEDAAAARSYLASVKRGQAAGECESRIKCLTGAYLGIRWTGAFDLNGDRFYLTGRDQTEALELREKIAHAAKMSSLGEMAGGIAHEINNPLAIIQGKASILNTGLKRGQPNVELLQAGLDKIVSTAERIGKIVSGLRTFSRNADADPFDPFDLQQVVDDALALCAERFRSYGVDLFVTMPPPVRIECRPAQIAQVLLNLLNNAFDAVMAGGELKWVRLDIVIAADDQLQMRVSDSGPGIPSAVVDKIMQPFFSTKEVGKGTGLGLSIAMRIMQQHRGALYVDRDSSHTCFVAEMPLLVAADDARAA